MRPSSKALWGYLIALLAANSTLLLPAAHPIRVAGAMLLIGLLPGLGWSLRFLPSASPLLRWLIAAALSYTLASLTILGLHYLPGPVQRWHLLAVLNTAALLSLVTTKQRPALLLSQVRWSRAAVPLLLILLVALFLRAANLHYSEFQGDEALAMITAAEALAGHEDALFLRSKGPGEVLLPMALWRLTGVINEPLARLPFTAAAMLAIVTMFLIGRRLGASRLGWLAAGFFAFNGFMVAFGRIVQYQALVVWLSAMAFLLVLQWPRSRRYRFTFLAGLCLGTGLLAHYDAILTLPAIGWLLLSQHVRRSPSSSPPPSFDSEPPSAAIPSSLAQGQWSLALRHSAFVLRLLLFSLALLLTTLPFYLPFALDPQANRTGNYVGGRIGSELRNNLPDFFHFNTFYSSFYYLAITGLLVFGLLLWLAWRGSTLSRIIGSVAGAGVLAVVAAPNLLKGAIDWSVLPFAGLLLLTFLALFRSVPNLLAPQATGSLQAVIVWLAVPFLGYNFVVALGLTHIYTIVPAWSLLAAVGWRQLELAAARLSFFSGFSPAAISNFLLAGLLLLFTPFLWNAFVRHDVEYRQDYPAGRLSFYWTPYSVPPETGFFGFAHRAGWKSIGQKIIAGQLVGDYGSNEEPDVTTWYTRGAPRACDPRPEFYYLADDLIDPVAVPQDILAAHYREIGQVLLPNQKRMQILQQTPESLALGVLDDAALARRFDATATPAAFARSARGLLPAKANFGNLIRLIGYDLDTRRAQPGGRIPVILYWQPLNPIPASYRVFVHLEGETGPAAQAGGIPVCWRYPTDRWRPGQIIADQHAIALGPELKSGRYPLEVGLFLPDTFERLDILDEAGNPAGTSLRLAVIEIETGAE